MNADLDDFRGVNVLAAAESPVGYLEGWTPVALQVDATLRACEEAGVPVSDIDGVFVSASGRLRPGATPALDLAAALGIQPRHIDNVLAGGASPVIQVARAAAAVRQGRCTFAVIAYGNTRVATAERPRGGWDSDAENVTAAIERSTGWRGPISVHALIAARHMHEYGTTREHLASVAVSDSLWAAMNPAAVRSVPLSVEDVVSAPMVSSPLGVLDCCLITDGGGAIIVGPSSAANEAKVAIRGYGEYHSHSHVSDIENLTESAAIRTGREAFAMAGMGPGDIGAVMLYDAFTDMPLVLLEDLGWCPKGAGGPFVASGVTQPGGELPMNTQGGGLSHCHPGMYGIFLIIEAVRQLQDRCGDRQVGSLDAVLCHGVGGGAFGSHATLILSRDS